MGRGGEMNELQLIGKKIISLPGRPLFMLDRDVAELYETETRSINQAVKRNPDRFPEDFCFQLDWDEAKTVIKMRGGDIFKVTDCDLENDADGRGKNIKYLPYAFTREGCNMLSAVLSTPVAVQRSIQIMRAFTAMERFSEGQRVGCEPTYEELKHSAMMSAVRLTEIKFLGSVFVGQAAERLPHTL
jgi:phage regulator Rha-like protein